MEKKGGLVLAFLAIIGFLSLVHALDPLLDISFNQPSYKPDDTISYRVLYWKAGTPLQDRAAVILRDLNQSEVQQWIVTTNEDQSLRIPPYGVGYWTLEAKISDVNVKRYFLVQEDGSLSQWTGLTVDLNAESQAAPRSFFSGQYTALAYLFVSVVFGLLAIINVLRYFNRRRARFGEHALH